MTRQPRVMDYVKVYGTEVIKKDLFVKLSINYQNFNYNPILGKNKHE